MSSIITAVRHYEPKKIITNENIVQEYEKRWFLWDGKNQYTKDHIIKILEKVGIQERRWVSEKEDTRTMATQSVIFLAKKYWKQILENIDEIIVGTYTSWNNLPSLAALVSEDINKYLNRQNSPSTIDISNACPSWLTAMMIADRSIRSGDIKKALVIGADATSKLYLWSDSLMLFGDAAGAMIMESFDGSSYGIQWTVSKTFPEHAKELYYINPLAANNEVLPRDTFMMNGQKVFNIWISTVSNMIQEYITDKELQITDFSYIIPHQANKRMLDQIWHKIWYDNEKILKTIAENGNTSSASPLLTLSKHQDKLQDWDRILLLSLWAWFNVTLIDIIWKL